jgi:hypothetical protein
LYGFLSAGSKKEKEENTEVIYRRRCSERYEEKWVEKTDIQLFSEICNQRVKNLFQIPSVLRGCLPHKTQGGVKCAVLILFSFIN